MKLKFVVAAAALATLVASPVSARVIHPRGHFYGHHYYNRGVWAGRCCGWDCRIGHRMCWRYRRPLPSRDSYGYDRPYGYGYERRGHRVMILTNGRQRTAALAALRPQFDDPTAGPPDAGRRVAISAAG